MGLNTSKDFKKDQFKRLKDQIFEELQGQDAVGTLYLNKKKFQGYFIMDDFAFDKLNQLQIKLADDMDADKFDINEH